MAEAWKHWEGQAVNEELRLGEYLGGSSSGAVFQLQCDDPDLQAAAIKLIAQDSPHAENRFASWRFASTLVHPNLIRIFQSGRCQIGDAKLLYVVMEQADENLAQIIPRRALTENEAREMLHPVLDALAYLHLNGLVHGHIKPANIMASGDQLKLSADGVHRMGETIDDPGDYDPPESASSPAGDVWSLGITLVEVTSQRLPAWNRNAMGDPRAPENLPAPLLDIARHSLRRDPVQRWTIREISERLTRAEAAPRMESPVARNASRGNNRYLIAALILFLASTGFVSLKLLNHSSRGDARVPPAAPKLAKKTLPEPEPAAVAAPPEKKAAAPVEERRASSDVPKPVAVPPVPAPKIPQAAAASSGVIHQVLPVAAQKSLDTIRGTVRVAIKVSVDSSGNVSDATIDSQGPSAYFANLALEAAQKWKFAPAHGGPEDRTIHFEFSPDGVKASAARSASE